MKAEIKEYGNSKVIILPPHYLKYMDLEIGDWLDLSDVVKAVKK